MPHMIGDVVPLISDDLIAYLKAESATATEAEPRRAVTIG